MAVQITARAYLFMAVPVALLLFGMGLLAIYSTLALGHGTVYGLVPLFLLDAEANVPTFFSALNLILCSALLMLLAAFTSRSGGRFAGSWFLLAVGALFVGVDEVAQIHELLDRNPQWTGGALRGEDSPWVLVYGVLTLGFVVATARLFLHLPRRYQALFALGAGMYVAGSIGLEVVGARELTSVGKTGFYMAANGIEEGLEMAAVILVNASLLSYIRSYHGPLSIAAG